MNSLILLPLLLSAAMAAPMTNSTSRMNNAVVYYPLQYRNPYLSAYGGLSRQGVPGITILAQQVAAALSNLQLYYTVQKWNSILCLLDSTCPQVVIPPYPPGQPPTAIKSCTTTGNCGELCKDVTASSGVVQSPDFPNDYGNDRDCTITIEGSSAIKLQFTTFNLEIDSDCYVSSR